MSATRSGPPLSIVHAVRQYAPSVGGIEAFVERLAGEQLRRGHKVRVLTLDRIFHANGARLPANDVLNGVEVRRIPYYGSHRYPIAPKLLGFVADASIVHVHAIDFFFDYLALTKALHKRRLIVSTHGGFFHTDFARHLKRAYFTTVTRLSLSRYDYVAASSVQDEQLFRRLRSIGIGLIENGVDIEKFNDLAARAPLRRILTFGRLAPHKNVPALFALLRELRARDDSWTLTVAGMPWGLSFSELRAAAESAGLSEAVDLIEAPSDDRLRELISHSSVFASASRYEGFGMAAVEAISAGLLPVLSDIPAHRRTLECVGVGTLVDFSQPAAAAAELLRSWDAWCSDYASSRSRAVRSADRYAWPAVVDRFDEVYRAVIG